MSTTAVSQAGLSEVRTVSRTAMQRIPAIDALRGLIMIAMALDHTRAFFTDLRFEPENLARTNLALFATRWVTHFCAPMFFLLAGTSAFLYAQHSSLPELRRFLWTRGLWLIVLEFTAIGTAGCISADSDRIDPLSIAVEAFCRHATVAHRKNTGDHRKRGVPGPVPSHSVGNGQRGMRGGSRLHGAGRFVQWIASSEGVARDDRHSSPCPLSHPWSQLRWSMSASEASREIETLSANVSTGYFSAWANLLMGR